MLSTELKGILEGEKTLIQFKASIQMCLGN